MIIDPILVLVIAFLIVASIVVRGIQNEKLSMVSLILAIVNLVISIVVIFLYNNFIKENEIINKIYEYYKYANYLLLMVSLFISFGNSISKSKQHTVFIKSIRNTKWNAYYTVDKKERIKDISLTLLKELDLNKNDVIGEKLFNVFNKSLRFLKINNVETNNKSLETYYENYQERAQKGESEIEELIFYNYKGEQVALNSVVEPIYGIKKYKGRVVVGEIKTDFDLLSVERNLNKLNIEYDSLNEKLLGIFETSNEGLFSIDLDERYIWISNVLVKELGLEDNTLDLNYFRSKIEANDLKKYMVVISELTRNNPFYQITYRINVKGTFVWFKEKGKRLFDLGSSATIIGSIQEVKTRHFASSDLESLDTLKTKEELFVLMDKLINDRKYFHLTRFKITNVPDINDKYGWGIGNLVLAEYINNIKETFVTESSDIFRISGLEFIVPITEPRKSELLRRGSENDTKFLNKNVSYGSYNFNVNVCAGISIFPDDSKDKEKLFENTKKALKIAENNDSVNNIYYFEDLK